MNLDSAKQTFAQEAEDLLRQMEDAVLSLEDEPDSEEHINSVFRAIHTIKGSAGLFGFDEVVSFTHVMETELDKVRAHERPVDTDLAAVLLDGKDHIATLIAHALESEGEPLPDALRAAGGGLLRRLTGEGPSLPSSPEQARDVEREGGGELSADNWLISLQFGPDALRNGMDPLSFIRYLRTLGEIVDIMTLTDRFPAAGTMDPESCYLGFRIVLNSGASKKTIEDVFEYLEDDCDIRILPPRSRQEHYLALLSALPDDSVQRLGELLVSIGALTRKEVDRALDEQRSKAAEGRRASEPGRRIGEILVQHQVVDKPVVDQALKKQEKTKEKVALESRSIRVDAERLGHLINLVGELVISSAAMKIMVARHDLDDVDEVVSGMEDLVNEIRDNALQLRMVPIGETFSRFRRIVRDVSRDLGKEIELRITGGESELDKTVVERINDPLTHLVRNAIDHGIETPELRAAAGKPRSGTIQLNAFHDSGHIVIQIFDDGAGLDPARIRAKAEAQGLVEPDEDLSRAETLRLIFEPGLSTKEQASNLSGRGVGMDVVRRNIEALRGSVELDSEPGQGTTVTIILPLTLAIIDGFLVGAAGEQYVIPLAQVAECVEIDDSHDVKRQDHRYVNLRGEVLPYLRLREFFSTQSADHVLSGRESLVVVRFGHTKAGLVVDELHGELQTVIKPLGKVFENLKGVVGATVLGTGEVALILDVQELSGRAHAGYRAGRRSPAVAASPGTTH